jgi:hypothetical protein
VFAQRDRGVLDVVVDVSLGQQSPRELWRTDGKTAKQIPVPSGSVVSAVWGAR